MIKLKRNTVSVAMCMGIAFYASIATAQDNTIGYVKTVENEAVLTYAGNTLKAEPGMPIRIGHFLKTGIQGGIGVTFRDNTMMSFGPNTEMLVDDYLYAPSKGDLKIGASLIKGTLEYVSGVIAKLRPEAVSIKTPVGIIGVRGTHFVAMIEETQP